MMQMSGFVMRTQWVNTNARRMMNVSGTSQTDLSVIPHSRMLQHGVVHDQVKVTHTYR